MLAVSGRPFDSDAHQFELKWDGTRAIALVEGGGYRLRNRKDRDQVPRYPELAVLAELPPGTVLDGEIVVLRNGRPDFSSLLRREQARGPHRVAALAAELPAAYVVFDILYRDFTSLMDEPLHARREILQQVVEGRQGPFLALSEALPGRGTALYERVCADGYEGLMAKRRDSRYSPGRRSDAWVKVKRRQQIACVVIGFHPEGKAGFRSLLLAAPDEDGRLAYVGRVGTGFRAPVRRELAARLWASRASAPVVPVEDREALWVEPVIFCTVAFLERTRSGTLRAPVFVDLAPGQA
jgi:DNA ligase D-like protein (predicted ligase)